MIVKHILAIFFASLRSRFIKFLQKSNFKNKAMTFTSNNGIGDSVSVQIPNSVQGEPELTVTGNVKSITFSLDPNNVAFPDYTISVGTQTVIVTIPEQTITSPLQG